MIRDKDVKVGAIFLYPHPDRCGLVRTTVVKVLRPTRQYPRGRVQHEAVRTGWGAVDTMEVFTLHARYPAE